MARERLSRILGRVGLSGLVLGSLLGIGCKPEEPKAGGVPPAAAQKIPTSTPEPTATVVPIATPKPTETATSRTFPTPTEVRPTAIPTPEVSQEEILQVEGLKTVWNEKERRWEYLAPQGDLLDFLSPDDIKEPIVFSRRWVDHFYQSEGIKFDPEGNFLIGWWDQKEKRFEVAPNLPVLRAEWKGLFVPWTAQETEKAFLKSLEEGEEKAKIPIPFDFTQGEIVWGKGGGNACFFAFRQVPSGIIFYAPFGGSIKKSRSKGPGGLSESTYLTGPIHSVLRFKGPEDDLAGARSEVNAGTPLVKFNQQLLISEKTFLVPNPGDYQIYLFLSKIPNVTAWKINFQNNLLVDSKGRFVYIGK